jgi:glycosyltransferase involved in cell wall biosynthesis
MQVKVSIVIPMFNSGSFIIEMIDCIIKQSYSNWELIIVDDVSTDGTYEKVINYIINEKRIKLIQRNRWPKGAQSCRNIGFDNCIGDYVMFFDADDLISINCLKQRVNFMDNNPELDFSIFPAHTINESYEIKSSESKKIYGIGPKNDNFRSLLKAEVPFAVWTNIYKRKSIAKISWDEKVKVFQDFYFNFLSIINNFNFQFCHTAEFDYFYRINSSLNAITSNFIKTEKVSSTIYLFENVLNILSQRDDFLIRKKQLFTFCLIYLERLLFGGKKDDLVSFLNFLKNNYAIKSFYLYPIIQVLGLIKNEKLKRLCFSFLMIAIYRNKRFFLLIINKLKFW